MSQFSFGNQPVVIQIFSSANVMVPGSNLMVPGSNLMVPSVKADGDFQPGNVTDQPPQYKK